MFSWVFIRTADCVQAWQSRVSRCFSSATSSRLCGKTRKHYLLEIHVAVIWLPTCTETEYNVLMDLNVILHILYCLWPCSAVKHRLQSSPIHCDITIFMVHFLLLIPQTIVRGHVWYYLENILTSLAWPERI